ncbi:MAG: hypothetical protein OXN93_03025, partial [bacterium]|nr:hypothetical protein [bacterium]
AFVYCLTWGNTDSTWQAFVNRSPAVCLVRARFGYSPTFRWEPPELAFNPACSVPGWRVLAHAFLAVGTG